MRHQVLFKEYVWLVNTIARQKRISLEEINRSWLRTSMSEGIELARSTFNRHREAIEEIFGIFIECDRKDGYKYFISNAEVLECNSIQNWMLSTMSVSNILSEHKNICKRILLETIPSSDDYLSSLIEAMQENRKVSIYYQKYSSEPGRTRIIEPFCIKVFRQRWYVLARVENGQMRLFSLDRIHNMEPIEEFFTLPEDFDAETYFKDVTGVTTEPLAKKQRIVIRAYGLEKHYLNDLPLHSSQREIARGENYTDFEYSIIPTADFLRQLMSSANNQQVIEPKWLADEIQSLLQSAAELYK